MNEPNKPPAEGKATVEPFITVCQCGSAKYKLGNRTKTAVNIECLKCGLPSSIKGNIAPVRVSDSEVAFAVKEHIIRPDPDHGKKPPTDEPKEPSLADQGYRTLRFKITEEQDEIIKRALEAVRVLNWGNDVYRASQWQGTAIEVVAADFLAGVDPLALQIIDAMDEKVKAEIAAVKRKNPKKKPSKRQLRKIRAGVRDTLTKKLGLWVEDQYEGEEKKPGEVASLEEYRQADEKKKQEQAADARIPDEGKMYKAITEGLVVHGDDLVADGGDRPVYLAVKPVQYKEILTKFKADGGVLLSLRGDERTKDSAGRPPSMFLWVDEVENVPDLGVMYDEIKWGDFEDAQLTIVELVTDGDEPSGLTEVVEVIEND